MSSTVCVYLVKRISPAGNFKMNGTLSSLKALVSSLDDAKLDSSAGALQLPEPGERNLGQSR